MGQRDEGGLIDACPFCLNYLFYQFAFVLTAKRPKKTSRFLFRRSAKRRLQPELHMAIASDRCWNLPA